jgi:hypothetical protein
MKVLLAVASSSRTGIPNYSFERDDCMVPRCEHLSLRFLLSLNF